MNRLPALLLLGACAASCGEDAAPSSRALYVAAATNLEPVFPALLAAFAEVEPGVVVTPSFSSTGALVMQIENGAPFDAFLSADAASPDRLFETKSAEAPSAFAVGWLAIWTRTDAVPSRTASGFEALAEGDGKIAVASPAVAPFGKAAIEALHAAGIYERVKHRLVFGENVAQTFAFAKSGAAATAVVALSQTRSSVAKTEGSAWEIPADLYAPPVLKACVLRRAGDSALARAFIAFLSGDRARRILIDGGYGPPPGE